MGYIEGIDISHWEEDLDWSLIPAEYCFAILKASEGLYYEDHYYRAALLLARAKNYILSNYHYFHPNLDPEIQADFYALRWCNDFLLPPFCDFEHTDGLHGEALLDKIYRFLWRVEMRLGKICGIYTGKYVWEDNCGVWKDGQITYPDWVIKHPLWLAQYTAAPTPSAVMPWGTNWLIWQYSDKKLFGDVAVDTDRYKGKLPTPPGQPHKILIPYVAKK